MSVCVLVGSGWHRQAVCSVQSAGVLSGHTVARTLCQKEGTTDSSRFSFPVDGGR